MAASCADSAAVDGGVSMVVGIGSFGGELRRGAYGLWLGGTWGQHRILSTHRLRVVFFITGVY